MFFYIIKPSCFIILMLQSAANRTSLDGPAAVSSWSNPLPSSQHIPEQKAGLLSPAAVPDIGFNSSLGGET